VNSLLREPLLQFLVAGAILFGFHAYVTQGGGEAPAKIVVTTAKIANIEQVFQRTWQRPPTSEELAGLIEDHVRDEVYYREGKALGVDSDDIVIRRRIRQKMEFFAEDGAAAEPTDAELADYLAKHPDLFRRDDVISFHHLFLSASKRGAKLDEYAELVSEELIGKQITDRMPTSDAFLLGNNFDEMSRKDVATNFGEGFATKLFEAPESEWRGPISSPFGLHFVFVQKKAQGGTSELENTRALIEREFMNARRQQVLEQYYQNIRKRYEIVVEAPPGGKQQTGATP
jgi:hypothetical protein